MSSPKTTIFVFPNEPACSAGSDFRRVQSPIKALAFRRGWFTFAELAAGPHAASDDDERGRRQDRLQWAGSIWDPLPCDGDVARAYGRIYATLKGTGRSSRSRFADLLIAATALAHALPLYTRNPGDFTGLEGLIEINAV